MFSSALISLCVSRIMQKKTTQAISENFGEKGGAGAAEERFWW